MRSPSRPQRGEDSAQAGMGISYCSGAGEGLESKKFFGQCPFTSPLEKEMWSPGDSFGKCLNSSGPQPLESIGKWDRDWSCKDDSRSCSSSQGPYF